MELTKKQAKENLSKLIAKFESELTLGKIWDYNEEATKTAFIQPLLKDVLGWNVNDRDEVSPEEKVSRNRVDYGLKIDDKIKIFVEAKPPKADLEKHIEQAVKYGYNRKTVPFVLLTDFEGLKLFDVTVKPDFRNLRKGLKIDLKWKQYLDNFDNIWLLSKESTQNGEIDKLIKVKPKDQVPVDKAILEDLKEWQEKLAEDIYKNNPGLFKSEDHEKNAHYLREITQRFLDRIIFMRFCEDRKFIHRPYLKSIFEERSEAIGTATMTLLRDEFKHYNIIFDSDLFRPQEWENDLLISFEVLNEIVLQTYNPYQFDVIPLEVLGNIYEQYLGYTIRLTDHQVKYELKPDVRKAGGVYYTPEYIVDYIVKNTVGKQLQELSAAKIKKLRILDPACGSGSFLIRAYEEMMNWYRQQKRTKKDKAVVISPPPSMGGDKGEGENQITSTLATQQRIKHDDQEHILSIEEKSQILREHIFGVDIDEQAVEVTKLSLMLKMLEGEFGILPGRNILPMLDKNIKCGNSLISGDTIELMKYFGKDYYKVKPFSYKDEFKQIVVDEGGFDAIIGNPPYYNIDKIMGKKSPAISFIKQAYSEIWSDKTDILFYFLTKAIKLSKQKVGFIVSRAFFEAYKAKKLREFILSSTEIHSIIDFNGFHVFEAGIATAIPILEVESNTGARNKNKISVYRLKTSETSSDLISHILLENMKDDKIFEIFQYNQKELSGASWNFVPKLIKDINLKIDNDYPKLGEIYNVGKGMETGRNDIFGNLYPEIVKKLNLETHYLKKRAVNSDIQKNFIIDRSEYLIYIEDLLSFKDVPLCIANYLKSHEIELKKRAAYQRGNCEWWKFTWPLHKEWYSKPKIICPYLAGTNRFALDSSNKFIGLTDTIVIFAKDARQEDMRYILALLNSCLLTYRYKSIGKLKSKDIYEYFWNGVSKLPIRIIDFSNSKERQLHDNLVALVDVILDLNTRLYNVKGNEKDQIQRQIEKTDKEIDELVYKLYGITKEEIKIIERDIESS